MYAAVFTSLLVLVVSPGQCKDHPDILNTCLDAVAHKVAPGPEPALTGECTPWRQRACCTANTTEVFHRNDTYWLNFNWNHCPGHTMSSACRTWFLRDLCYYECSPNHGPWLQKDNLRIRKERVVNAPLCQSECSAWWNACKDEFTCLDNWGKGFNWTTGTNVCPAGSTCRPFSVTFKDSTTFCQQVWNYSWKVVPDSQSCMKIHFNGTNPNDAVARKYAMSSSGSVTSSLIGLLVPVCVALRARLFPVS